MVFLSDNRRQVLLFSADIEFQQSLRRSESNYQLRSGKFRQGLRRDQIIFRARIKNFCRASGVVKIYCLTGYQSSYARKIDEIIFFNLKILVYFTENWVISPICAILGRERSFVVRVNQTAVTTSISWRYYSY